MAGRVAPSGCLLSHRLCWQWLLLQDAYACALVLEDDCCVDDARFRAAWTTVAAQPVDGFDVLVLGHHTEWKWELPAARRHRAWTAVRPIPGTDLLARRRHWFIGTHCYLVTRAGARRLLDLTRLLEVHADWMLSHAMNLGLVRGYSLPSSVVSQCLGRTEASIVHIAWSTGYQKFLPGTLTVATALLAGGGLLAALVLTLRWLGKRKAPASG